MTMGKWSLSNLPAGRIIRLIVDRKSFSPTHLLYRIPLFGDAVALVLWENAYRAATDRNCEALAAALKTVREHPIARRNPHYYKLLMQHVEPRSECMREILTSALSNLLLLHQNFELPFIAIALHRAAGMEVPSWLETQARLTAADNGEVSEFKLVDMSEAATDFQIVEFPGDYRKRLPAVIADKVLDQESRSATTPIVRKGRLSDVTLYGSGLVIRSKPSPAVVHHETGVDLAGMFTAGHRHFVIGAITENSIVVRKPAKARTSVPRGVLLGARAARNYFHWLIEYLPRLLLIEDDPTLVDHHLLVRGPVYSQQLQALASVAPSRPVYAWTDSTSIHVDDLVVVDGPCFVSDDPRLASEDVFACNPALLGRMRDRIIHQLKLASIRGTRRIFLARDGQRDIVNSTVKDLLKREGFEVVRPQTLSFYDQVKLFREAEIIAGPSGAAFTNLLFSQRGAKALVFNAPRHARNSVFSQLADIAGASVAQVVGFEKESRYGQGVPSIEDAAHRDYSIPTSRVKQALDWAQAN